MYERSDKRVGWISRCSGKMVVVLVGGGGGGLQGGRREGRQLFY